MDTPNNSISARSKAEREDVEKITDAELRKPGFFKRFRGSFIAGDLNTVKEHVLWNVLVPSLKDTFLSMGDTFLRGMVNGDTGPGILNRNAPRLGQGSNSKINYAGLPGKMLSTSAAPTNPTTESKGSDSIPQEVMVNSHAEGEAILGRMQELIDRYQSVTFAELKKMIGRSPGITDDKYGWSDLSTSELRRIGGALVLILPKVEDLSG